MEPRNLIYLEYDEQEDVELTKLISANWAVHRVRDIASANALLDEKQCHVGIVRFEGHCSELCNPKFTDILFATPYLRWIAILQSSTLLNDEVCQYVSRYFYDYHVLPVDRERLNIILGHAYGTAQLARRAIEDRTSKQQPGIDDALVGDSAAIITLRRQIKKIAKVETPVLITGESGTGKELVANMIHQSSERAAGPFIAVNCAALPASLIQAELFGYEKGSFTGAFKQKTGRIEAANKGTIFLDEIGDLPPDMQITLLRFLDQHTIEHVGGIEPIHVDVRVIAATNVDLHRAIEENRFREDLYYRLKVLCMHMPNLQERGQDLEMLANQFINKFRDSAGARIKGLSHSAIHAMYSYHWPGNVRELMNSIRGAMVMGDGPLILPEDLGLERRTKRRSVRSLEESRGMAEKAAILNAFENSGSNITLAAEYLDISRGSLYRLMQKHAITWPRKVFEDEHGTSDDDGEEMKIES